MLKYKQLSDEQKHAIQGIKPWYAYAKSKKKSEPYVITGAAGTGKSTILPFLLDALNIPHDKTIVLATSGTAANHARKQFEKAGVTVKSSTIARYIYQAVEVYNIATSSGVRAYDHQSLIQHMMGVPLSDDTKQSLKQIRKTNDAKALKTAIVALNNELLKINHPQISVSVKFELKDKNHINNDASLIIVDEAGMVTNKQIDTLESFGVPLLLLGDTAQLGPIVHDRTKREDQQNARINNTHSKYHHELVVIQRQTLQNPINALGHAIRTGSDITAAYQNIVTSDGSIFIRDRSNADSTFWATLFQFALDRVPTQEFILLAQTNDHVALANLHSHNELAKRFTRKQQVYEGEPLTVTFNDPLHKHITNGTQIVVRHIHHTTPYYIIADIELDGRVEFNVAINTYQIHNTHINPNLTKRDTYNPTIIEYDKHYETFYDWRGLMDYKRNVISYRADGVCSDERLNEASLLIFATYGYALTIHKAQGKEWDIVALLANQQAQTWTNDERDNRRLYYTAITRCKQALYIVEPSLSNTLS